MRAPRQRKSGHPSRHPPVYDESRMPAEALQSHQRPGRRAHVFIALLALALVLFPFLFLYHTWFGRKLSDAQLNAYFADRAKPRHIQHALVQLGERVSRGQNAARWYPLVIAEAASPNLEIRQTAAWIMGQDRGYPPFHAGLLKLIHDPEAMVRRNAALGLAAFGDGAARGELVAMLRPFLVRAAVAGPLRYRLKCAPGGIRKVMSSRRATRWPNYPPTRTTFGRHCARSSWWGKRTIWTMCGGLRSPCRGCRKRWPGRRRSRCGRFKRAASDSVANAAPNMR